MEASQAKLDISQQDVERIAILCKVAKVNRAMLPLKDVVSLTTLSASEEELEKLWGSNEALNSAFSINSGFIFEKNDSVDPKFKNLVTNLQDNDQAECNFQHASRLTSFIRSPSVRLVAVSGSTAYDSARRDDDVDFFCVTKKNEMWFFMVKTLLLARINRLGHRGEPSVCFSCVMDEGRAMEQFSEAKDPLFARDALTAKPLHGLEYFQGLLTRATWMKNFYPRLYSSKLNGKRVRPINNDSGSSAIRRILNSYLFHVVGRYIRLKSNLLNRRLAKEGKMSSIFAVRMGDDHCIFESVRYRRLREMYSKFPDR